MTWLAKPSKSSTAWLEHAAAIFSSSALSSRFNTAERLSGPIVENIAQIWIGDVDLAVLKNSLGKSSILRESVRKNTFS